MKMNTITVSVKNPKRKRSSGEIIQGVVRGD
jgi:hypothetical protein